jgi:hypothetical protein
LYIDGVEAFQGEMHEDHVEHFRKGQFNVVVEEKK